LYIGSTLRNQGPVRQLYNLVKYLDREMVEPVILTLSPESSDSLVHKFRELNVSCYCLGLSRLAGVFLIARRIKRFLQEHPVDIISAWAIRGEVFVAAQSMDIPRIATKREGFLRPLIITYGFFLGTLMNIIHSLALKKFDRIICVSESLRQTATVRQQARFEVIHSGVDEEAFCPVENSQRAKLKGLLRLPQDKMIILSIGHLVKGKDPQTVIRGFLASKAAKSAVLVFLGDGPLKYKCQKIAGLNSNVLFPGHVENVQDYLRAADVLVSASLTEGMPNAVMEALACGLCVVLSDIPPHREILCFDYTAGELFKPKNFLGLRDKLNTMVNADITVRKKAAVKIISHHLNARRMSGEYQSMYLGYLNRCKEVGKHTYKSAN